MDEWQLYPPSPGLSDMPNVTNYANVTIEEDHSRVQSR